ncbi:MAG: sigma 54-interacting transcriptional regulator, partial [Planctomycetota bacterium]|nr:sigma 54-interacting transcriptional regulator [Planctomycetota bacterium]
EFRSDAAPGEVESLLSGLCPSADVLAGQASSVPIYLIPKKGQPLPRLVHFFPLEQDRQIDLILIVISPLKSPHSTAGVSPAQKWHAELASLRLQLRQRFGISSCVANSSSMQRVLTQMQLAKSVRSAVHFVGEAGTGKEHLARSIHYDADPKKRSFVPLDCRQIPVRELKQTVRRLLADNAREGDPSAALYPGTVFLINVECTPRDVQEAIIEAYQPGGTALTHDLRLMSSSTHELTECVNAEELLEPFYLLLTPLVLQLPPLRHRKDDLELLSQHFLERDNKGAGKQLTGFAADVLTQFREYNWPGNLDELSQVVNAARASASGSMITIPDLPLRFRSGVDAQSIGPAVVPQQVENLEALLTRIETEQIQLALEQSHFNKSKAADALGITRPRLYRRMEQLGIVDREDRLKSAT